MAQIQPLKITSNVEFCMCFRPLIHGVLDKNQENESEMEKATIHDVHDSTSMSALVSTFRRLSVRIKSQNNTVSFFILLSIIKPSRCTGCLHHLPCLQSQKQFPLNLLHVRLIHLPLHGY